MDSNSIGGTLQLSERWVRETSWRMQYQNS